MRTDAEGQGILTLLRCNRRPRLLFGHRIVPTLPDGRWNAANAEHADLLLLEAIETRGLERAPLRPPDADGVHCI